MENHWFKEQEVNPLPLCMSRISIASNTGFVEARGGFVTKWTNEIVRRTEFCRKNPVMPGHLALAAPEVYLNACGPSWGPLLTTATKLPACAWVARCVFCRAVGLRGLPVILLCGQSLRFVSWQTLLPPVCLLARKTLAKNAHVKSSTLNCFPIWGKKMVRQSRTWIGHERRKSLVITMSRIINENIKCVLCHQCMWAALSWCALPQKCTPFPSCWHCKCTLQRW